MVVGKSKSDRFDSEASEWTGNPVAADDGIDHLYDLEYILNKTGAGKLSGMESERNLNEPTGFRPHAAGSSAEASNPSAMLKRG
jgi:hypothetical protein